jgi:hypothetical protein
MSVKKVIFDTDPGGDDVMALVWLAAAVKVSPQMEWRAHDLFSRRNENISLLLLCHCLLPFLSARQLEMYIECVANNCINSINSSTGRRMRGTRHDKRRRQRFQ